MEFLKFDASKCTLCGDCVSSCPFGSLTIENSGIVIDDSCRMCSMCVRSCPEGALHFEQRRDSADKSEWRDFLVYVEQEDGRIHPVAYELINEARRMADKVGYHVNCVIVGGTKTTENAKELLDYGVDTVYAYEHLGFSAFAADCFADAIADCISSTKPSSVLIGGTSLGRGLAPRLSTRFHTGLTADCTSLDIESNTDMVQIRPAFGGNVMAQIAITHSRPQFATVRYRIFEPAKKVEKPWGTVISCPVTDDMARSRIEVLEQKPLEKTKAIEDEDILVVAGRGVKNEAGLELCQTLADKLGGVVAFTRPMVEQGIGDQAHQIGLSGRTVRPKLIITCGVSGAIQFTTCMKDSECIVAINSDPNAQIFKTAHYCITDDLYAVVPAIVEAIDQAAEE